MIRTYVAEHGGTVLFSTPSRRQKKVRTRIMALVVIAAIAASTGMVQAFQDRERAHAAEDWTP
ncbi:hypothetical protein [Caulobacter sp. 1776]|uniref:hypothetical protein n=1 Tax=Caulobacter sp. 1776 TaxID=3156420 RepID=UPI00339421ED